MLCTLWLLVAIIRIGGLVVDLVVDERVEGILSAPILQSPFQGSLFE